MSLANLFLHGLGGQQDPHLRCRYMPDSVSAGSGKAAFKGDELWEQDAVSKQASLDQVVSVRTISDRIREDKRSFWNQQKSQSLKACRITFVIGLAAAVATAAACSAFPPLIGVVVLTSVVATVSLGTSALSLYRYLQAKGQYQKWEDPLPKWIEQRRLAGQKGFLYIYEHKLSGTLATREETQALWQSQMEKTQAAILNTPHLPKAKVEAVRDFFTSELLSEEKLSYAHSGTIPASLSVLSAHYQSLKGHYAQLLEVTRNYQRSVQQIKRERLRENDRQRDWQLAPWISWFELNDRRSSARGQIRSHAVFSAMTAPIHYLHAQNRRQINDWARGELQKIANGENLQAELFFNPVVDLVMQYQPLEDKAAPPVSERLYPDLDIELTPSAPELQTSYSPPAYNPEWQEIVSRADWENGVYARRQYF